MNSSKKNSTKILHYIKVNYQAMLMPFPIILLFFTLDWVFLNIFQATQTLKSSVKIQINLN